MGSLIMDTQMGAYGKLFIIPQDPTDREILLAVDRRTRADVEAKFGVAIDYDWQANTVANCLVETLISDLSMMLKGGATNGIGIEFYDILKAVVSIKTNSKAEKEGNINIYFEPGAKVDEIIANGPPEIPSEPVNAAQYFITGVPEDDDLYKNLEYHAKYNLSMTHGTVFPEHMKFTVFAIGYTFLQNIYVELLYRLATMVVDEGEEKLVSVNFNDNIEFHAVMKGETVTINMRPGMNAKLLIKCDEITEHTMGDD